MVIKKKRGDKGIERERETLRKKREASSAKIRKKIKKKFFFSKFESHMSHIL